MIQGSESLGTAYNLRASLPSRAALMIWYCRYALGAYHDAMGYSWFLRRKLKISSTTKSRNAATRLE